MGVKWLMGEGDNYQFLKYLCKKDIILTQYMLSARWMNFMEGLRHYMIRTGEVDQVMVLSTSLTELGYTYVIHRLNKSPDTVFIKLT